MSDGTMLSIIIPAYNVAPYIEECLDSISKAVKDTDIPQIEVIVIDDASTDGTLDIIKNYTMPFRLITIINEKNEGVSIARNKGIDAARGKYIMCVDSDDYLVPDALGKVLDFLRENESVDMVQFGYYELWVENGSLVGSDDKIGRHGPTSGCGQYLFSEWVRRDCFDGMPWQRVILRSIITDNNLYFYPNICWEDDEWTPRVFGYAKNVVFLPYKVYVYRLREGSITRSGCPAAKKFKYNVAICDSLAAFAQKEGFSTEYANALRCYATDNFWRMFEAVKVDGVYNEDVIKKINERRYLIPYSRNFRRRWIYRFLLYILGIKCFSFIKH